MITRDRFEKILDAIASGTPIANARNRFELICSAIAEKIGNSGGVTNISLDTVWTGTLVYGTPATLPDTVDMTTDGILYFCTSDNATMQITKSQLASGNIVSIGYNTQSGYQWYLIIYTPESRTLTIDNLSGGAASIISIKELKVS